MPLSDQETQALTQALLQQWQGRLAKQFEEMKLRQWCVEQAVKAIGEISRERRSGSAEFCAIYSGILEFITQPFADVFKGPSSDS